MLILMNAAFCSDDVGFVLAMRNYAIQIVSSDNTISVLALELQYNNDDLDSDRCSRMYAYMSREGSQFCISELIKTLKKLGKTNCTKRKKIKWYKLNGVEKKSTKIVVSTVARVVQIPITSSHLNTGFAISKYETLAS